MYEYLILKCTTLINFSLLAGPPNLQETPPQLPTKNNEKQPTCGQTPAAWDAAPAPCTHLHPAGAACAQFHHRTQTQPRGRSRIASECHRRGKGSGGAAIEMVGTAAAMVVVTAAAMHGATPANGEGKHVSVCLPVNRRIRERWLWLHKPRRAYVGGHGRAYLGARRRSCRPRRSSDPSSEAGARRSDGQGCILESTHPLRSVVSTPR